MLALLTGCGGGVTSERTVQCASFAMRGEDATDLS